MTETTPEHLTPTVSARNFQGLPVIPGAYGGHARVYESSAASGPHIWLQAVEPVDLNKPDGPTKDAMLHLTAENAIKLAEQLVYLVQNHYQGPSEVAADALTRLAQDMGTLDQPASAFEESGQ